jgi:hypothetical protein
MIMYISEVSLRREQEQVLSTCAIAPAYGLRAYCNSEVTIRIPSLASDQNWVKLMIVYASIDELVQHTESQDGRA